LNKNELV